MGLSPRALALPSAMVVAATFACRSTTDTRLTDAATILVSPDSATLLPGQARPLAISVFDGNGDLLVGVAVSYASSDSGMVKVSAGGVVTAVGPTGRATVTISCPPASKTLPVVIVPRAPTSVTVNPPAVSLQIGDSTQLSASVRDQSDALMPGATVTFASADTAIAKVTASGMVRGTSIGSTLVTASSGAARDTVPVRVTPPLPVLPDSLTTQIRVSGDAYGIDVSGSGVVYATIVNGSSLARLSLATLALVDTIHVGDAPTSVAFAPGGATAYVTNQFNDQLGVVDVATDSQVATVAVPANPFVTLVSPDGSRIIVTGNTDSIFIVNAATKSVIGSLHTGRAPNALAFNAAGTRLYVSNTFDGNVVEVDPATPAVLRTFNTGGYPQGLALSADGTQLYIANQDGYLEARSIATGARTDSISLDGAAFGLARSPDNGVLYVGLYDLGQVAIVDRAIFRVAKTLITGGSPRRIAFTADGRHAVIANLAGWVDVVTR